MYDNSIFANRANFEKFTKKPSVKAIDNDLALQYCQSKYDLMDKLVSPSRTWIRNWLCCTKLIFVVWAK